MNILHIVAGDLNGGAAKGAYWLHCGLKELGINSNILTNSKTTLNDENIFTVNTTNKSKFFDIVRKKIDKFFFQIYSNRQKTPMSLAIVGYDFRKTKLYKEADIIHLHWINGGFVNVKHLSKINKPIVWTMRDMWPLTGGCHVSLDCERYKTGCGQCPQLNSQMYYDLSKFILNRKQRFLPKDIKLVGISNWLSSKAEESYLFRDYDIRTISNNIDTASFFPVDKSVAKQVLGLQTDKKIILCGAAKPDIYYKGFSQFMSCLDYLDRSKYFLCFFGQLDEKLVKKLGFEYNCLGYLNDIISLRLAYCCADVFVAPSMMDAFAKTIAESMACGTPSVCFNATGPKDIITHQEDGYKAAYLNVKDLANGVEWVVNHPRYDKLCKVARKKTCEQFDNKVIARQYIDLYKEILEQNT